MAIYFAKSTNAFYNTDLVAETSIPEDKVQITEAEYRALLEEQLAGKIITSDSSGKPVAVEQICGKCSCTVHEKVLASTDTLGHVKVDGSSIFAADDGTISASDAAMVALGDHEKKIASTTVLGHVKVDGDTITADADGTLRGISQVKIATVDNAGIVKPDGTTIRVEDDGTLSVFACRNIFDIFYSMSSQTPVGAMDLSLGTLISQCDEVLPQFYKECVSRASAGTIRTLTEAQWQAEVAKNGSCGSFVVDTTARAVRLPKITSILQVGDLGVFTEAGLPNITGKINATSNKNAGKVADGAFYTTTDSTYNVENTDYAEAGVFWNFDASRSSEIYGKSDTVQPATVGAKLYIQVYNSAIQASTAQAAEFIASVEECTKDIAEVKDTMKETVEETVNATISDKISTAISEAFPEDYVVEYTTSKNANIWYRKYKSGWVVQGGVWELSSTQLQLNITHLIEMSSNMYAFTFSAGHSASCNPIVRCTEQTPTMATIVSSYPGVRLYWHIEGWSASS